MTSYLARLLDPPAQRVLICEACKLQALSQERTRVTIKAWSEIPVFADADAEHAFWSTHRLAAALLRRVLRSDLGQEWYECPDTRLTVSVR